MNWYQLDTNFIQAMVQAMYRSEAAQVRKPDLLTNEEIHDLYCCYCSI